MITMNRISTRVLSVVAVAASIGAVELQAQTTFTACRVPDVGAIYMIGVEGAPTACLDASHVQFSWTEGGTIADASITEAKLADGAVTSTKIAGGAVTSSHIATNGVGSSELGLQVNSVVMSNASDQFDSAFANCPTGKVAIGGGFDLDVTGTPNPTSSFRATESHVTDEGTGWQVVGYWPSTQTDWTWTVTVICIIDS